MTRKPDEHLLPWLVEMVLTIELEIAFVAPALINL